MTLGMLIRTTRARLRVVGIDAPAILGAGHKVKELDELEQQPDDRKPAPHTSQCSSDRRGRVMRNLTWRCFRPSPCSRCRGLHARYAWHQQAAVHPRPCLPPNTLVLNVACSTSSIEASRPPPPRSPPTALPLEEGEPLDRHHHRPHTQIDQAATTHMLLSL